MVQLYNYPFNRHLRSLLLQCMLLLGLVTTGFAQTPVTYDGPWRTPTSANVISSGLSADGAELLPSTSGGSAQFRTTTAYVDVKIQDDAQVGQTGYKISYSLRATTTRTDYSASVKVSYRTPTATVYSTATTNAVTTQVSRESVYLPSNATNVRFELAAVSEAYVFLDAVEIAQKPEVAGFTPAQGVPGTDVTIKGVHLKEATAVSFGAIAVADFTVVDSTTITTKVPVGAASAPIKVITPYGEATSAPFLVPAPEFAATVELDPSSAGAGETITLYGQYFTGVNQVLFNNVAADPATITVVGDSEITVSVPNGATSGPITVISPAGQGVSVTPFTVLGPQIIATEVDGTTQEFAPASGAVSTPVIIYGEYFTAVNEVLFNGVAATGFTVDNDNQISVAVPLGASTGLITVRSPAGEDASTTAFDVPAPTIASFEPISAGPGMKVVISGTNLSGVSSMVFLGDPASTEDDRVGIIVTPVTSDTELVVTVPTDAKTGKIQVIAPGEKTATSEQVFTFVPAPAIASVATTEGGLTYSIVGKEVTITGQNFATATAVKLGTTTVTPYNETDNTAGFVVNNDGTAITFLIPENAKTGSVAVTTLGGEAAWEGPFEVIYAPVITSISPAKGPIGQEVIITGQYLKYVSEVLFLGSSETEDDNQTIALPAPNASDSEIKVTVPTGAVTGLISVTNPANTAVSTDQYEVVRTPVILSFTPTQGVAGTVVAIKGYNFTKEGDLTAVTFAGVDGAVNAADFEATSDTTLTATVPGGAITGVITVSNAIGSGESPSSFNIIQKPTITSLSPLKGVEGSTVVIEGTEFVGDNIVITFLGEGTGVVATSIEVDSPTKVTATVPAGAVTGKLLVTNAAGNSEPSADTYTVVTTPEITAFNPKEGKVGDVVTIEGWLLNEVTGVNFNGTAAEFTMNSTDGNIVATVPTNATTGPLSLVVNGVVVNTTQENYKVIPAPTIVSFDPTQGVAGTVVTITGTNFIDVSGVSFNGIAADTSTIQVNETFNALTVTVPDSATTGKIKVTADAGEAVSEGDFTVPVPANITFTNNTTTPTTSYANQLVTVRGQYFTNMTAVTFGGKPATIVNTVTDELDVNNEATGYQLITVKAPFDGGVGKVAVTTLAGTGTSTDDYTVIEPRISSISAAEGYVDVTVVIITGELFTKYWDETLNNGEGGEAIKAPVVDFNGTQVTATTYTDTEITVTVPNGATSGNLTVLSGSGESEPKQFNVLAPVLSSVAPAAVYAGEQVVISGTNFINVISMTYGGIAIPDFDVLLEPGKEEEGTGTITFIAPVVLHSSSNILSVTSESGTGTSTALTVYKPVITSVTETGKTNDTRVYAGVNTVTITGSRFDEYYNGTAVSRATPIVTFAGANNTRVTGTIETSNLSTTEEGVDELVVAVPANAITGTVRVQSGSGTGQANGNLTIIGPPTITGFSTYAGLEGTTFTITGSGFDDATEVKFLGIDGEADESIATYTVTSPTAISVTVPTGATIGKIAVTTPYNGSTTVTSTQIFRVVKTPIIHDFIAKEGPSGTVVTITGESLIDVNGNIKVFFRGHGGEAIPAVSANQVEISATVSSEDLTEARQVTVVVPNDAITGVIRVANDAGETTTAASTETEVDEFTVTSPVIVRFEHTDGSIISASSPARIKETVLIRGYQLKDLGTAKVGTVNANFFERATDATTVEMLVPEGATTNTVSITAAEGNETSSEPLYIAVPTITVTPTSLNFKVEAGKVSAAQSYTVSATNLAVGESLNMAVLRTGELNDFSISFDANAADEDWVKTLPAITPDASGTVSATEIWVRSQPGEDADTDQEAKIDITSPGATTRTVTLNSIVTPLPVELLSFKATAQGNKALLTWVTASEKDNSHFEIETSLNAADSFEKVGHVESKSINSSIRLSYAFTHTMDNASGTRYYRLKQVDLDGAFEYSKVIAVEIEATKGLKVIVAPNPLNYNSKVFITAEASGKASLVLHNMAGKQLFRKIVEVSVGQNELQLPLYDQLQNGLYVLTVELQGQRHQVKVVKQ